MTLTIAQLKTGRKMMGMTQVQLSRRFGFHDQHVKELESGKTAITQYHVKVLARELEQHRAHVLLFIAGLDITA